jgi:hypothetical protein
MGHSLDPSFAHLKPRSRVVPKQGCPVLGKDLCLGFQGPVAGSQLVALVPASAMVRVSLPHPVPYASGIWFGSLLDPCPFPSR